MNDDIRELNNIIYSIGNVYREAAVKLNITETEMEILYVINMEGNVCNQSCLYKKTGITKSTINSALHKMQERGEIQLLSGEGRNVRVELTDKGKIIAEKTACRVIAFEEEIFAGWSERDRQKHIALNKRFLKELKEKVSKL